MHDVKEGLLCLTVHDAFQFGAGGLTGWHDAMEPGLVLVTHFTLYQSHLAREGSIYEPLIEYNLTQQA